MATVEQGGEGLAPTPPGRLAIILPRLRWAQILAISIFWLALNFHWAALGIIILPSQVFEIVGPLNKGNALAFVLVPGAFVALFSNPLFGFLSDLTRGRLAAWGRRRPYILAGTLINIGGLLWMAAARDIPSLAIAYVIVQFSNNAAAAPFHALLPDIVPVEQRGLTSGVMGLLSIAGNIGGVIVAGLFVNSALPVAAYYRGLWLTYGIIIAVLVALMVITVIAVRERRGLSAQMIAQESLTPNTIPNTIPNPIANTTPTRGVATSNDGEADQHVVTPLVGVRPANDGEADQHVVTPLVGVRPANDGEADQHVVTPLVGVRPANDGEADQHVVTPLVGVRPANDGEADQHVVTPFVGVRPANDGEVDQHVVTPLVGVRPANDGEADQHVVTPLVGVRPTITRSDHPVVARSRARFAWLTRETIITVVGTLIAVGIVWGIMALWNVLHVANLIISGDVQQVILELIATVGILRLFDFNPRRDRDFAWVFVTRLVMMLGIYTVEDFLQFYMRDAVRVSNPEQQTTNFIIILSLTSLFSAFAVGWLSDRFGRKRMVYLSGGLMALVGLIFIITQSLPIVLAAGAIFGLGYGAYISVDWALVADVLPSHRSYARDMGVWNIALSLPQVIAPVIGGPLIDTFTRSGNPILGYQLLFAMAILYCVLGTVTVRYIRGVAK